MLPSDISGQGFPYSPRFGGGYGRERTATPLSGISGQRFPYPRASAADTGERANNDASVRRFRTTLLLSPRIGGGYGRERTVTLPSGISGQRFPYPRASAADTGENEQRCFRPAFPDNTSPIPTLRRRIRERERTTMFPSGISGQRFPYSALLRRVRRRANNDASVRHFQPTLPLLRASAAGTGESEQRCSRPAVPDNDSPIPRASAADTGENEQQCPRPAVPANASPVLRASAAGTGENEQQCPCLPVPGGG